MSSGELNKILKSTDTYEVTVDYVISSCRYTAEGLCALLKSNGKWRKCNIITAININSVDIVGILPEISKDSKIVVFFQDEPSSMLRTLHNLALLCRLSLWPLSAIILSRFRPTWLFQTLRCQVKRLEALSNIRAASVDISVGGFNGLINSGSSSSLLISQISEKLSYEDNTGGLTTRELEVVLGALCGVSIKQQSQLTGLSIKTLYTQRLSGNRKLIKELPELAWLQPRHLMVSSKSKFDLDDKLVVLKLSNDELEFEQAIRRKQVYPVFQPIVDRNMNVQGFEILIRWFKMGKIIMPAEFLPKIQSMQTWMLLTAFVVNEAILQIKRFSGKYYFSVNVPACVTEGGALMRMMYTAKNQLQEDGFTDLLVLEFAESTDFFCIEAMDSIHQMVDAGFPVLLDDCFSKGSVIFPVRKVQFTGYKIDISIINTFIHNHHDECLVKSLVEYCRLTNGMCIAEGVDTRDKFNALVKIGINAFQGYYISEPVLAEHIENTLYYLLAKRADTTDKGFKP